MLSYLSKKETCNVQGMFGHLREACGFPRASESAVAESKVGKVIGTYLGRTLTAQGLQRYSSWIFAAAHWSPRASSASPLENKV